MATREKVTLQATGGEPINPLKKNSALLPTTGCDDGPGEPVYRCPLTKEPCDAEVCNFAHFELGCVFPEMVNYMDSHLKSLHVIRTLLERIAVALECR